MKRNKGERRGTKLDLFLILLTLLSLTSGFLYRTGIDHADTDLPQSTFLLELYSDGIDSTMFDCLQVDEALYQADGSLFGTLTALEKLPLSVSLIDNGALIVGEWDEALRCRIHLTVTCTGSLREEAFLFEGRIPLGIGEAIVLRGRGSELQYRLYRCSQFSPKTS